MSASILEAAVGQFSDWRWRLNNLYWITDKSGRRVRFEMNWGQAALFDTMHFMNAILKARQIGFTTFIQIFMLDQAVFNSDVRAGTIAHTLGDAQAIFKDKVKYPYDNLPGGIRSAVPTVASNTTELELANNSSIRVGASLRSGTLQYLHISEYGKLCAKYPEKAREVRTGALNTVQAGQVVFIESTAEGQEGHYYELCQAAQSKARAGSRLTELDFKFHFFSWWQVPEYEIDPEGVPIGDDFVRYFEKLEAVHGIVLSPRKRAWYAKKAETQLDDMKREYPSTPEEAFEASVEGAYYAKEIAKAELQGRIGRFKADPNYPVRSIWDIGFGDATAIWFYQVLPGVIRWVGYYENSGEGMPHYLDELERLAKARGWKYQEHGLPHDIKVHEWTVGLTRLEQMMEQARSRGLGQITRIPRHAIEDRINAMRVLIGISEFDEEDCAPGMKALKAYRKEWDEDRGVWKNQPRHDWASHASDAGGSLGMIYKDLVPEPAAVDVVKAIAEHKPTLDELIAEYEANRDDD